MASLSEKTIAKGLLSDKSLSFLTQPTIVKGYLLVIITALLWSVSGPIAKLAYEHGATPAETGFWRAGFGALFFWLHALRSGEYRIAGNDIARLLLFGALCIAAINYFFMNSVRLAGAGMATVLLYTAPIYVAIMSRFFFKEHLSGVKKFAIVLGFAGVACISLSEGAATSGLMSMGVIFGLLAGAAYSVQYIVSKIFLSRYSGVSVYCYGFLGAMITLFPFVSFTGISLTGWLAMLAVGFFSTYLAYCAYGLALKILPATKAVVAANVDPLFAALVAWMWWGEVLPPVAFAGAACVIAAVFLMARE